MGVEPQYILMTDNRGAVGSVAIVVTALLLAAAAVTATAGGMEMLTGPSGEAILDDAEQRYDSAETVVGAATVTVSNETRSDTAEVTFAATDDNESRVAITGDNGTVVAGTNGSVTWVHDEATGVTRLLSETDASQFNESQNESAMAAGERFRTFAFDWTRENTTATRVGTATVGDSETYVVEVESTNESRDGTITYWVDQDSSVVHKQRYTGENGTVTIRYTETRFDVSVADSTFQPPGVTTPQTVETFDELQAGSSVTVPALTDAEFSEGYIGNDGQTAVATYQSPNVSVVATTTALPFQADNATQTTVGGVTVNVTSTDDRTVVAWQTDDRTIAVVTDEGRAVALAVAERLVEATP